MYAALNAAKALQAATASGLSALGGLLNVIKINEMSMSTAIAFGDLQASQFSCTLNATLAGQAVVGAFDINLANVSSTVQQLAADAWATLTSWTRRTRRAGGPEDWLHFIDALEPDQREEAIELLLRIFSVGPLGAVLPSIIRAMIDGQQ